MDNATTMRTTYDLLNAGDIDGFGDLLTEDFVEHEETPGLGAGKEGVLELFRMYLAAFPDLHMEPVDVIAAGDRAVARVTASGTQHGEFMGMPASGKRAEFQLVDIMRFGDTGKVCEHWGVMDMLSMLQQLGASPDAMPASPLVSDGGSGERGAARRRRGGPPTRPADTIGPRPTCGDARSVVARPDTAAPEDVQPPG